MVARPLDVCKEGSDVFCLCYNYDIVRDYSNVFVNYGKKEEDDMTNKQK